MKPFAALVLLFAVVAFLMPGLGAQDKDDAKKDVEKKDAKDDKKGDEKKTDEKKDDTDKKASAKTKTIDPEEEKILKGTLPPIKALIKNMDPNSAGEITVQLTFAFPAKVQAANVWRTQQLQLKSPPYQIMMEFKKKMSEANIVEVRAGTGMKVRTKFFPMEYDSKGNLKRPTPKEISAMKGNSKLPGFPAQFDALKAGQIVDLYLAKVPTTAKKAAGAAKDNKKKNVDDDVDDMALKPEVMMIVVVYEAPQRP